MVNLHIFENNDIPEIYECQVLSFLRINSFEGFTENNRLRDWITPKKMHPVNFVLEENDILISHLEVLWKNLEHKGQIYRTYGLTGVLTYPAFRKQGYGLQLLKEAKKYIEQKGDGDIVFFNSHTNGFYEKAGFVRMNNLVILKGDKNNPEKSDETAYMLFLSDKAKDNKADFESGSLYFGEDTW